MFMQWLWMAGHHYTVLVNGTTPGWPLSYFSTMQTSMPKLKASWPLCTLLLGLETAGTPWNSSWWIATSNQGLKTTHKKPLPISPGGQASITTSLKSWKTVPTLHLRLNGSSHFLKLQSTSASYVWDVKYPHIQRADVSLQKFCWTNHSFLSSDLPDLGVKVCLRGISMKLWWMPQSLWFLSEVILTGHR